MAHGDILHEDYYISDIYSGSKIQIRYKGRDRIPTSLPADGVFTDVEDALTAQNYLTLKWEG